MRIRSIKFKKLIFVLLIVISVIPDIGIKFSTFGFTWTLYRLYIPICLLSVIFIVNSGRIGVDRKATTTKWIRFMLVWSIYGIVLLFVGKYSETHNGFVEWLSIVNGLIVFYILGYYLKEKEYRDTAIRVIYWLLNGMIVIGLLEIATGKHWPTSAFYDVNSSVHEQSDTHQATGLMYNMNDFSALITCMSPVLVANRLGNKRLISLIGILFINLVNDATACTLAIIVFTVFYLLILKGGKTSKARLFRIVFWVLCVSGIAFFITNGAGLATRNDFIGAFTRQIINAKQSSGSLYARLIMYKDAFFAWISTGMLGMGPAGYSIYFSAHTSISGLMNPHSLILEILTQYGIIIAGCFVGLLIWMYRLAKKQYNICADEKKNMAIMVIAFIIIYTIASFAPSAFIGYSYQWVLIAITCSYLDKTNDLGGIFNA